MTFKIVPRYKDDLWYPILVKIQNVGYHMIVEMQGKKVNEWNDMVRKDRQENTKNSLRGWCV